MKSYLPIILVILLLCSGCWGPKKHEITTIPEMNTQEDISKAQEIVKKSTDDIGKATEGINQETLAIKQETSQTRGKIPSEVKKEINPHLDKIDESSTLIEKDTQNINKAVAELSGANSLLDNAGQKIVNVEEALQNMQIERDEAVEDRDEAIKDKNSQLHKVMRWLIVGCLILTGVFAVLFVLHGNKFGLTGAAVCGVICALAIFVETYFIYVAIFGGIILLGLVAGLIYTVIIRNKAFREVIDTVEVVQDNMDLTTKEKIFGGDGETGIMDTIQSKSTMELVQKEKSKMDKLWAYAKRKKESITT